MRITDIFVRRPVLAIVVLNFFLLHLAPGCEFQVPPPVGARTGPPAAAPGSLVPHRVGWLPGFFPLRLPAEALAGRGLAAAIHGPRAGGPVASWARRAALFCRARSTKGLSAPVW